MADAPLYVSFPSLTGAVFIDVHRVVAVSDTGTPIVRDESEPGKDRVTTVACVVLDTGTTALVEGPAEKVMQRLADAVKEQRARETDPWAQHPASDRRQPR